MGATEAEVRGPAIIQYWDREDVPGYIAELLATHREFNPDLPHLVFSERHATEFIGEHFGGRKVEAFRACAVPAMQSDYFRYCAVHALGGVYADTDFACVRPLRRLLEEAPGGILFGRPELPPRWRTPAFEWRERVGPYRAVMNSFFAFPSPGHPLPGLAVELATANVEGRVADDVALVTGPAIFTSLYLLRELGSFDAFVSYAKGGVLETLARPFCATIGDVDRVPAALEGVRLATVEESGKWVAPSEARLPYKDTEDYWVNVTTGIFR